MRNLLAAVLLIFICCQSCDKGNSVNTSINGTYESGNTIEVSSALMFTSSAYGPGNTGGPGPIRDQQVIAAYLQRHNISGFSLNTPTLPYNDKITLTIADSGKVSVSLTNPAKTFQAFIEENKMFIDNTYGDSVISIVTVDSIPYASIPKDSCYGYNSTAAKLEYQVASTRIGNGPTQFIYRRKYFTQFKGTNLAVKFVTSNLSLNTGAVSCSNSISNEWGTDAITYLWGRLPQLGAKDTLIIQTRQLILQKR